MRADDQDNSGFYGKTSHVQLAFLGQEFLTWLYFYIDQVGGEIDIRRILPSWPSEGQALRIGIGKRITLRPISAEEMRVSVVGSALDDSGEVLQAIRSGAYVDQLSLDFVIGERVHHFIVQASDGGIGNAKTDQSFSVSSDLDETENPAPKVSSYETILLRMSNLDEIEDLLDGLFAKFLNCRLAHSWVQQDVAFMRQNVAEGLLAKLPSVTRNLSYQVKTDEDVLA